jgi:DNA-binding XRE family transcriptional regulator
MYHRLKAEIANANLTAAKLAVHIGVTEKTMRCKLNGEVEFSWSEVLKIRNIVAPHLTLEKLFVTNNNAE